MTFEKMTLNQRIQAANIDCMRHPQYALLSGVICMGKSEVSKNIPTAATNGRDKKYGEAFIQPLNRKQLRYLVLHENFHVALKHCILYRKRPRQCLDLPTSRRTMWSTHSSKSLTLTSHSLRDLLKRYCIDRKYFGWSFPQVLNDLLKQGRKEPDKDGNGDGGG
jgi:hypothetical protein